MSGISFIVRVRNEEKTLEESVRSLFDLTIIHEINIILHCCTDGSEAVAKRLALENKNINIFIYNKKVSRAGYENLATDANSDHSFVKYSNYCFGTGKYPWKYKWDADFIASDGLIEFLNSKSWEYEDAYYLINYKFKNLTSSEIYLSCATISYNKYLFWETISYKNTAKRYVLNDSIFMYHKSELTNVKSYWLEEPWYISEESDEARIVQKRIEQLTQDFGAETVGMARAMNPECNSFNIKIIKNNPSYVNIRS